jgi:hypothetical protein
MENNNILRCIYTVHNDYLQNCKDDEKIVASECLTYCMNKYISCKNKYSTPICLFKLEVFLNNTNKCKNINNYEYKHKIQNCILMFRDNYEQNNI